jgi:hypothetical protein
MATKLRAKAAVAAPDTSTALYVQPNEIVEPIVEVNPGEFVLCEPMKARDVPREGEPVELDRR